MSASHLLRCRCGRFEAELAEPRAGVRAVCYCRDCQSYAHFLGDPARTLDALGGTEVTIVRPDRVALREGAAAQLACMSLSPQGTLRWYTACCRTPLGNTARTPRVPHLGLVHTILGDAATHDAVLGPVRMRVNRPGAHGTAPGNAPIAFVSGALRYMAAMAAARLAGAAHGNPFFAADGRPRVQPHVLTREERDGLRRAAASAPGA